MDWLYYGAATGGTAALVTVLSFLGRSIWPLGAAARLIKAELVPNHGGTLLDRASLIPEIKTTLDLNGKTIERNHEEAREQWDKLHGENRRILERVDALEKVRDEIQRAIPQHMEEFRDLRERVRHIEESVFHTTETAT